jgi:hypothetical protein
LYIAANYAGTTFDDGNGTNEDEAIAALELLTYGDVGYFENFEISASTGEERIILTDYCSVGEVSRKTETVFGFSVDLQEILEMSNFAKIFDATLNTTQAGQEIIGKKRAMKTNTYKLFKFETCPVGGKKNTFYFVKCVRTGDTSMPFTNLNRDDLAGVTIEFEVSQGGNFFVKKEI